MKEVNGAEQGELPGAGAVTALDRHGGCPPTKGSDPVPVIRSDASGLTDPPSPQLDQRAQALYRTGWNREGRMW